jgi:hypothetical protein
MAEALRVGIDVRPPHVNESEARVRLVWEGEQPVLWLGLGCVRDLRRRAVAALVQARQAGGAFGGLRELLMRVPLQDKEVVHLIQGGALDGLGASRPALLADAEVIRRAGTARQLPLDLGAVAGAMAPASLRQRWAWEQHLLGYPLGALRAWLPELAARCEGCVPLETVAASERGGRARVLGVRLPGWHRGGFAFWDGARTWVWAEPADDRQRPPTWEPVAVTGQWRRDRWGMGLLVVNAFTRLSR